MRSQDKACSTAAQKPYDTNMALIRIIACFFVVMIHSTADSAIGIFYNSLARFAVPVFVLLSGYYMLAKDIPLTRIFKKIFKLFSLVLVWSFIYYLNPVTRRAQPVQTLSEMVRYLLTQPFHIWYLYAAMSLYLFTPVFRVFIKNADRGSCRYALALCFLFGSIMTIAVRFEVFSLLAKLLDMMKLPYAMGFCFLYLLGGYFRKFGIDNSRVLILMGALGTLFTVISSQVLYRAGMDYTPLHSFYAPGVIFSAVGVFALSKKMESLKPNGIIRKLSDCTLGIYLVHPYVTLMISDFYDVLQNTLPEVLYTPVRTCVCFVISSAVVLLLRKIPFLKKVLL